MCTRNTYFGGGYILLLIGPSMICKALRGAHYHIVEQSASAGGEGGEVAAQQLTLGFPCGGTSLDSRVVDAASSDYDSITRDPHH